MTPIRVPAASLLIFLFLVLPACTTSSSSSKLMDVLDPLADTDTKITRNTIYLGPSNNIGLGSVWSRSGSGYLLKRLPPDLPWQLVSTGNWVGGSGRSTNSVSASVAADVIISQMPGLSAGLKASLSKVDDVQVTAAAWREVQIIGDDYSEWVTRPENEAYRRSMTGIDRVVVYRALQVKGLEATLHFTAGGASEAFAKYDAALESASRLSISDISAGAKAELGGDDTLVITASTPFIIRAEFGRFTPEGDFRGGGFVTDTPPGSVSLGIALED